jgi:hypothetical protein
MVTRKKMKSLNIRKAYGWLTVLMTLLVLGATLDFVGITNPTSDVIGGSAIDRTNTMKYTILCAIVFLIGPAIGFFYTKNSAKNLRDSLPEKIKPKLKAIALNPQIGLQMIFPIFLVTKVASFFFFSLSSNRAELRELIELLGKSKYGLLTILLSIFFVSYLSMQKRMEILLKINIIALYLTITFVFFAIIFAFVLQQNYEINQPLISMLVVQIIFITLFLTVKRIFDFLTISIVGLILLITCQIPGVIESINYFEDYPYLNVHAFEKWGYSPWKELQLNHGLYSDFLRHLFGYVIINPSVWGMQVGTQALLAPIEMMLTVILIGSILKKLKEVFLITLIGIAFLGNIPSDLFNSWFLLSSLPRMLPLLIVTRILQLYLKRPTTFNLITLVISCSIGLLWSAEGIAINIGVVLALVLTGIKRNRGIRVTVIPHVAVTVITPMVLSTLILTPLGLSKYFLEDFQGMTSNILQGNLAFNYKIGILYTVSTLSIPIILSYLGYLLVKRQIDSDFNPYVYLVPTIVVGGYFYIKFLAWPDLHIQQATNSLSLLWFFIALKLLAGIKRDSRVYEYIRIVSCFVLVTLLVESALPSRQFVKKYEGQLISGIGIAGEPLASRTDEVQSLKDYLVNLTGKSDLVVLDFTNAPVEINLLTDLRFVPDLAFTSFYVSSSQQSSAIKNIRLSTPDAIIWEGPVGYSNSVFPGEMYLRNYLISKEILDNYSRVHRFGRYTILVSDTTKNLKPKSESESITRFECNWGKSVTTFNRQELLKGEDETSKILKVSNDYFTDKSIPISSIAGFFVRATKPGQYEIKAPDQLTSVKFSLAEADFRKVGQDPLYIPVANCPQWRLSNQLTSEFQSNSPDLTITQLSRFNGRD